MDVDESGFDHLDDEDERRECALEAAIEAAIEEAKGWALDDFDVFEVESVDDMEIDGETVTIPVALTR